jgi:hypothetical protein
MQANIFCSGPITQAFSTTELSPQSSPIKWFHQKNDKMSYFFLFFGPFLERSSLTNTPPMEIFLKMDPVLSVVDHGAEVTRLDIVDLSAKVEGCATHVVQPWIRHGAKHITTNQGDECNTLILLKIWLY